MDLFETPEVLPQSVKDILDKYSEMDQTYENCQNLVNELEQVGYTCDYGLDGIPYDLKEMETETFNFYVDTKVTTWMRTEFEIEAKTLEEARAKAIEFHNQGNTSSIGWDEILNTKEMMSVEENGGQPTE